MDNIISVGISSIFTSLASIFMWSRLYEEKINYKKIKNYIIFILLVLFTTINYIYVNNFLKIFTIMIAMIISNYFIFKKKLNEIIVAPIISQFLFFIVELLITIVAFGILKFDPEIVTTKYFGTIKINLLISFVNMLLINTKIIKKLYKLLIKCTDNLSKKTLVIVFCILVLSANFYAASQYYKIDAKYMTILNCTLTIVYSFIVFKMLQQKNRYIKISNKYNMTNTTLKELEQNVTRLKITNHENKNQLLTIRNMIKKGEDGKSLIKHIENIVNTKIKDDETLMLQTSTITNSMISSIVYSKMLTMKENDVDAALIISRDIKDLYLSDIPDELAVEVCKIIGVYLDNALEEVSKYEEKIINIEFYAEKKTLCIAISNNFEGEIDFEKMDNPGYTTKENGHGYGLSLAHEIIESNDRLSSEREIKDNIFKQILKIKM